METKMTEHRQEHFLGKQHLRLTRALTPAVWVPYAPEMLFLGAQLYPSYPVAEGYKDQSRGSLCAITSPKHKFLVLEIFRLL